MTILNLNLQGTLNFNYAKLLNVNVYRHKTRRVYQFFVAEWYFQRHILAKALELTRDEWLKKKI